MLSSRRKLRVLCITTAFVSIYFTLYLRKEVNDNFYHIQTQAPDASSISGANQQQLSGSSSDICTDNPYMLSVNKTFEELHKASKMWLTKLPQHLLKADGDRYKAHDHQKFFPFESMGTCNEISCIGGKCSADASKIACGISNLRRLDSCIVYSIGGNNHWEFELDILEKTNCEVHTFDCTGPVQRFVKPENDRLHFHHICLGTTRSAGPLAEGKPCTREKELCGETWTMTDIQSHFSHKQVDLLKLDIEGWEWTIFDQDYAAAALGLNLPMQLLMEVHYCVPGRRNPRLECRVQHNHTLETASDVVRFQSHLLKNGYVVVNRDDNPSCPHCTELTLLRQRQQKEDAGYDDNENKKLVRFKEDCPPSPVVSVEGGDDGAVDETEKRPPPPPEYPFHPPSPKNAAWSTPQTTGNNRSLTFTPNSSEPTPSKSAVANGRLYLHNASPLLSPNGVLSPNPRIRASELMKRSAETRRILRERLSASGQLTGPSPPPSMAHIAAVAAKTKGNAMSNDASQQGGAVFKTIGNVLYESGHRLKLDGRKWAPTQNGSHVVIATGAALETMVKDYCGQVEVKIGQQKEKIDELTAFCDHLEVEFINSR